jgi:serine protease Do
MRYLRRFFVLAVLLVATGAAQAQISSEYKRDGPAMLKVFRPVVAKSSEATVRVFANGKTVAYGTIVDADGLILTKWDEVRGSEKIVCRLHDGTELEAKLVGVEKEYDLAMLKVDASQLPTVQWEDIKKATVGRWVASAGTGEDPLAVGVISVAKRKNVLGDQPPKNLNINSGWLGVGLEEAMGAGAKVNSVAPKSPAEKAGLKINDIVFEVGGRKVVNPEGLIDTVGKLKPGDDVLLKFTRGDEELEITARLAKRPKELAGNPQETMGTKLSNRRGGFPFILQHDSGLRPDFCGGPLVDIDGKVVGINIARAGRTETYAIPADEIQTLLPKFKKGDFAIKEEAVKKVEPPKEPEPILRKSLKLSDADQLDKDRQGLKVKRYMKAEEIELTAGSTYIIEMQCTDSSIDPYLILEDAKGTKLAEDDNSGGFPNAKIVFQPTETGRYRIIATTYGADETGNYTLIVRMQAAKGKK